MPDVIFEAQGKFLLILHALCAILLLGTTTHNVLISTRYLTGAFKKVTLEKLYVKVGLVAYLLTFGLGALIYPSYRYHVRDQHFDISAPWASNLFDIKEHWSALGLCLFFAFFLMSRQIQPSTSERSTLFFYVFLSMSITLIVWFGLISGLLLTSVKSV